MSISGLPRMWTHPIKETAKLTHLFITLSYNLVRAIFFYFSNHLSVVACRFWGVGVDCRLYNICLSVVIFWCWLSLVGCRLSSAGNRFSGAAVYGCGSFLVVGCWLNLPEVIVWCRLSSAGNRLSGDVGCCWFLVVGFRFSVFNF